MIGPGDQLVFLVDADDIVRDSLKVLIESHGLRTEDYRDAAAFLAEANPQAGTCLVFGCNRHVMDGIDLVNALRHRNIDLPVIFVVGSGSAAAKAAVVAARAGAYLESPLEEATLLRSIEAIAAGRIDLEKSGFKAARGNTPATRRPMKQ